MKMMIRFLVWSCFFVSVCYSLSIRAKIRREDYDDHGSDYDYNESGESVNSNENINSTKPTATKVSDLKTEEYYFGDYNNREDDEYDSDHTDTFTEIQTTPTTTTLLTTTTTATTTTLDDDYFDSNEKPKLSSEDGNSEEMDNSEEWSEMNQNDDNEDESSNEDTVYAFE